MKQSIDYITKMLIAEDFQKCVFSDQRIKEDELRSVNITKINSLAEIKVELRLKKHNDIKTINKKDYINNSLEHHLSNFKQVLVKTSTEESQILLNKKLKAKIITKEILDNPSANHNRSKKYLIPEGEPCLFLFEIGVMDESGKVKSNYYKKFKQINRFLEMVNDLYKDENFETFHAVDFGCGKSYLTFALYHYFVNIKKVKCKITGIDLKQEVINHCNDITSRLKFDGLKFVHGFIHDFKSDDPVDFVVTLHACDTATDDAILFSLRNDAKKMMFVPCCQHELNKQIKNSDSAIMLKHGIFKDRMTSLVTDTMRTQLLEACGYKVQSMEFIDLEHTAKNILLRCSKVDRGEAHAKGSLEKYLNFKSQWNIDPYLEKQLKIEKFI